MAFIIENSKANFNICARCGQAIKNVCWYRGKPYGTECIKAVTGQPREYWVFKDDVIDEQATADRETKKQANWEEWKQREREREQEEAQYAIKNAWLINSLKDGFGSFSNSMVSDLKHMEISYENFTIKQLRTMCEIYGKKYGRKGSKKYNEANKYFWNMVIDKERGE